MNAVNRSLEKPILRDLEKKFLFLSGPRQVGKTTLAEKIIKSKKGRYLLYDDEDDRRSILQKQYVLDQWVCLDEFHKFGQWKNHIKGVFDKHHKTLHLLLTGSARLDVFQKSGDSLFGRYYLHHLHPLTCGELNGSSFPDLFTTSAPPHKPISSIPDLLKFGGFPEPFYSQSEQEHRRWSNARRTLLIQEELRDLTHIELLGQVEQLMLLLPQRIGSLFSYRSLAEDIQVSPITINSWMDVFQRLFIVFSVPPYHAKINRALQKQPKYYFYDWSQVEGEGGRFENFVASHLWKAVQQWTDMGVANLGLHYVRDRDGREVDFLLTKDNKPWFMIESKLSDARLSDHLQYFSKKLGVPGVQLLEREGIAKKEGALWSLSANQWLAHLP